MSSTSENPEASAPVGPTAAPKPGLFQRIGGVLTAPEETFQEIVARPKWGAPLLLWMVLSLIGGVIVAQLVDFNAAAREVIEQRRNVPADAIDRAVGMTAAIMKISSYASPVFVAVVFALVAGAVFLVFRMTGAEGTFAQSFAVTLYAWTPNIIQSIIFQIIVLARSGDVDLIRMQSVVRSNPSFLVDPVAHPLMFQALGSVDAFRIWTVALFIIGFAVVGRTSKAKSAAIVVSLWVFAVVCSLVPVALRSMQ